MISIAVKPARFLFGAVLMGSLLPACVSRRQYIVARAELDRMSPHLVASCDTSSVKATRDDADAGSDDKTIIFIKACSIDHSYAGAVVGLVGVAAVPAGVAYARSGSLTTTVGTGLLIMGVGGVMAVAGGVMALVGASTVPHEIDPRDEARAMTPRLALTPGGVNVQVPLW
jgi:hypothetical protein